jgi:xanthine dehydrogenase accessory factor
MPNRDSTPVRPREKDAGHDALPEQEKRMKEDNNNNKKNQPIFHRLTEGPVTLYTYIDGPKAGGNVEVEPSFQTPQLPAIFEYQGNKVFGETLALQKRIVVFGCGHVGTALYKLARFVGYPVTMVDDRSEFATQERFPEAEVICEPYDTLFTPGRFGAEACFVIVTRGHSYDAFCLERALDEPHAYVGMMGSAGKVAITRRNLLEKGVDENRLAAVHAPIGLSIGANTPEEIAISILAEIMQSTGRQKHVGECPAEVFQAIEKRTEAGVEIIIVERSGSAPRSVGSRMFVTQDTQTGSVGGGPIEAKAIEKARELLQTGGTAHTEHYSLSNAGAQSIGMVCGGAVTLLFVPRP